MHVGAFTVLGREGDLLTVAVTVSSGTYVRALARDLGEALSVGAHLTALRRTRVGDLATMTPLEELSALVDAAGHLPVIPLAQVLLTAFHPRHATPDEAVALSFGRPLELTGVDAPVGVVGPDGAPLALLQDRDGKARPIVVFAAA